MKELLAVYRTELIKTKNSFASWLVILGALFIPAFFVATIAYHWRDYVHYLVVDNPNPWNEYSRKLFNGVHFTFLPLLIVLIVALVFNIEHKSNTWKHIFVLPVAKTKIFTGKYHTVLLGDGAFVTRYLIGRFKVALLFLAVRIANHTRSAAHKQICLMATVYKMANHHRHG